MSALRLKVGVHRHPFKTAFLSRSGFDRNTAETVSMPSGPIPLCQRVIVGVSVNTNNFYYEFILIGMGIFLMPLYGIIFHIRSFSVFWAESADGFAAQDWNWGNLKSDHWFKVMGDGLYRRLNLSLITHPLRRVQKYAHMGGSHLCQPTILMAALVCHSRLPDCRATAIPGLHHPLGRGPAIALICKDCALIRTDMPEPVCICYIRRRGSDLIDQTGRYVNSGVLLVAIPEFILPLGPKPVRGSGGHWV